MEKIVKKIYIIIIVAIAFSCALSGHVFAQNLPVEREERTQRRLRPDLTPAEIAAQEDAFKGRWKTHIKLSYGYDTNALLGKERERDDYESIRVGVNYRKTLAERHQLVAVLTATHQNYNEHTDISNSLANLRTEYKGAISKKYVAGVGHDISLAYYEKNSGSEYMFNKVFVNFQHRVTDNFFHKLQYEYGWKHYDEALALLTATDVFSDNRRKDTRHGPSYSIGYTISDRLSSNMSITYFMNDSNSDFQNYYDYQSIRAAPRISYQITDALSANLSYSFKYKTYDDRLATGSRDEQIDKIHNADFGLNYRLSNRHSFTLDYTYQQNASNNESSNYSGNSFEAGWRFVY